jgi:hypothetical protein
VELRPAALPDGHKKCTGCHAVKSPAAYAANKQRPDGKQAECRACYRLRYKFIPSLTSWHRARAKARARAARGGAYVERAVDKGGVRVRA